MDIQNLQPGEEADITKEPYKGPGPVLTSAGYLYASHGLALLGGVIVASAAGFLAHKHVNKGINWLRDAGQRVGGSREKIVKALFGVPQNSHELHSIVQDACTLSAANKAKLTELIGNEEKGFFEKIASKITKWAKHSKQAGSFIEAQSDERLAAALTTGGLGGAAAWIGSTVWSIVKGSHVGNKGKRQFNRAVTEIKDLRERNEDLEAINNKLHDKIVEISIGLDSNTLTRKRSNTHTEEKADVPPAAASGFEHQGTLHTSREAAAELH